MGAEGTVLVGKIPLRRGQRILRRNGMGNNAALGGGEIHIGATQRARMAARYPHLYSAPAQDILEAVKKERKRSALKTLH